MAKCHNCYICVTNHHRQPSKHTVRTAITYGIGLEHIGNLYWQKLQTQLEFV